RSPPRGGRRRTRRSGSIVAAEAPALERAAVGFPATGFGERARRAGSVAGEGGEALVHPVMSALRTGEFDSAFAQALQDLEAVGPSRAGVLVDRHGAFSGCPILSPPIGGRRRTSPRWPQARDAFEHRALGDVGSGQVAETEQEGAGDLSSGEAK